MFWSILCKAIIGIFLCVFIPVHFYTVCIEPIIKCIKKKLNRRTGDTRVDAQEQSCNIPPENNTREQEAEARERRNRLSSTENPIVGQPARETPICRPENTVNLPYMNQNTERIPIAESRERNERLRNGETLIWREPTDYSPGQTISLPLENQIGQEEAEARESSPNRLIYRIIYPSGHVVNLPHMNQNSESLSWISTDESQERRASRLCSEEYHIIFTEPRHFSSGHTVSLPLENNIVQEEPDFTTDQQPIYTICAEVIEELPTNNDNERREEFQPDVNWTLVRELSNSSPLPPSYDDVISRPPPSYDETLQ
ncbi:uncharacterized protein LOC134244504 isoform X2 [Saccostrea cucullata]